jgi:hypothetical protein|tara:strand:+ start:519 stop:794 length:276 start_codon:yes stop_codon:yes gene_type:complete
METQKTTNGRTITTSGPFLDPKVEVEINPPRPSGEFDEALYYDGIHYFPKTIKHINNKLNTFEIQGCFYDRKWRQDTFHIGRKVRDILLDE